MRNRLGTHDGAVDLDEFVTCNRARFKFAQQPDLFYCNSKFFLDLTSSGVVVGLSRREMSSHTLPVQWKSVFLTAALLQQHTPVRPKNKDVHCAVQQVSLMNDITAFAASFVIMFIYDGQDFSRIVPVMRIASRIQGQVRGRKESAGASAKKISDIVARRSVPLALAGNMALLTVNAALARPATTSESS